MKISLIGINAKYIHTNLAIRSIRGYYKKCTGEDINLYEYTINNNEDFVLSEIYKNKPDVIGFSCYIWNIEYIKKFVIELKKILPKVIIILGGPEVSYDYEEFLIGDTVDYIVKKEGEKPFVELISAIKNNESTENIKGIVYKKDGVIVENQDSELIELDEIPFVYNYDFGTTENKIIYYETSRGCPFNCQYCLSSVEAGVRFLGLDRVYEDLKFFLDNNVKQVKFVDRTFNARKQFCKDIWSFLIDNDNGVTNFHFELAADIIDDEMLEILKNARVGLFQFEVGVQSTNEDTLDVIKRKTETNLVFEKVKSIAKLKNIHQHLDLIVGLPCEDIKSFKKSFNDVYTIQPEQLQIGFLKLLRGSGLRYDKAKYGIKHKDYAPYEVLSTNWLTYDEVLELKGLEEMVETFYNSGKFIFSLKYVVPYYDNPFEFYSELWKFFENNDMNMVAHKKIDLYKIFFEFCKNKVDVNVLQDLLKLDLYINENIKSSPEFIKIPIESKEQWDFYNNEEYMERYFGDSSATIKQIARNSRIDKFDIDIVEFVKNGVIVNKVSYVLFEYVGNGKQYTLLEYGNAKMVDITKEMML